MKRVMAITAAMALTVGVCIAGEAKIEKPAKAEKSATASPDRKRAWGAAQEEMWKKAGCSDEEIAKLKELQQQFIEARKAKDEQKVKQIREEMDKILTPERKAKISEMRAAAKPKAKDSQTTK
ncbi:MAG: hypothetical protein ACP5UB_02060 [Candidatus Sumerlaeaceae bacterium]